MSEKDISAHVICDICQAELETVLSRNADVPSKRYDFELRVIPCETCTKQNEEENVTSIRLCLNEKERESVSIL